MEVLLDLMLLSHLTVIACGHPILEAPENMTGPWKGDVNIPCTYHPQKGYTQVMVRWVVRRDSDPVTIFQRDSSGDHIQQAKYRGRLHVSQEVPGVVSLQLNSLAMDDRSHYTCEVTWQAPDGNQVIRDKIIDLRIQKLPVSKPTVTTGSGYGFTVPQGMRISLQCQAWGSPPIIYVWYKEQDNNQEPIKVADLSTLLFQSAVVADSGSYFCTAKGRVGSEQRSNIVKFVVKDSLDPFEITNDTPTTIKSPMKATSTLNPSWNQTAKINVYFGETTAGPKKGRGLPMFAIILITSLCCMVVITMAFIIHCRKTSQQKHDYEVNRLLGHWVHAGEGSNSGETMRVTIFTTGCSSDNQVSLAVGNDYSDES
ncbi:V-set and immunoglobulin domain-containing protein 4 isoform X2 [Fukomys damarensis]|uniref:V-set and immunoglobulin domain-containing protein 4 isoform X2 n=1 Tax=Fukomys damarensis TaxID=885580 RepID=UPI0004FEB58C|nr:V-set and immunoglobulin domain-containing protein 4 isoform X2 [Fukomys damarensis]KFO29892.1 V-set and immunoglobulin domain-containing protein 4 [Fukomys damarensis]